MTSEQRSTGAAALSGGQDPIEAPGLEAQGESNPRPSRETSEWLLEKALASNQFPAINIRLWDGRVASPPGVTPVATMHVHDRVTLFKVLLHPELYFGEGYMHGRIEVEGDLVAFLETIYKSRAGKPKRSPPERLAYALQQRVQSNSIRGSRDNIHHHYDLSNEFYQLWLDRAAMQYTCAYFPTPEATLEQAQVAKLDHVCRKLRLKPGDRVIEAGCGWGGLARHMAKHYGAKVQAYNISHQQVLYAREKAAAEGLDDQVEYIEDDYRNIHGECDVFVSIGMLEHVGPDNYAELGGVIDRVLQPAGRGLIHSIGRIRPGPMNAWIAREIFPGAQPPSLGQMMAIFEGPNLAVLDVENLRLHYAETLRHWLARFEQQAEVVERMFDKPFVRAWRLYLAGSVAVFSSGQLQLYQVLFNRQRNNDIPLTREYIYRPSADTPTSFPER